MPTLNLFGFNDMFHKAIANETARGRPGDLSNMGEE